MDTILFRSKIDLWLLLVLLTAMALPIAVAIWVASHHELDNRAWIVVSVAVLPAIFIPLWILLTTNYRLEASALCVRSGPLSWQIPLSRIRTVSRTRSLLSGPALSLDRLLIRFEPQGEIMISPKDRARFLAELLRRAPDARLLPEEI
ncbi:MAG: PH domain-containing protein [Stagnimonas sp.]|nr:PH domain-containing protein [Stagnimonas sp.]